MKGLEAIRDDILFGIYPAVKVAPFYGFRAIQELPLHPLEIAEPGAIGEGGEHAGRDEIWGGDLTGFFICQLVTSWSDKEDYILDKYI